jgi:hypothetical protein
LSPKLELTLERDEWAPGERVRGRVLAVEGGRSRELGAQLCFCEASNGYETVAHSVPARAPLHTGDLEDGSSFPLELALPADAPPAWSGPGGRLYWEVRVRSDEFGVDTKASREITVVPPRRE